MVTDMVVLFEPIQTHIHTNPTAPPHHFSQVGICFSRYLATNKTKPNSAENTVFTYTFPETQADLCAEA